VWSADDDGHVPQRGLLIQEMSEVFSEPDREWHRDAGWQDPRCSAIMHDGLIRGQGISIPDLFRRQGFPDIDVSNPCLEYEGFPGVKRPRALVEDDRETEPTD